jgi:transcriptional regulator with PAS, ATPase and Fis domain
VAYTDCTILIDGESGTGKELFAHSIHSYSNRRKGPFIAVNCASLPHALVESELFGYEKGSFTGALGQGNPGKFELANGGTIFLDEIGELPLEIQAKLLRVLDTHRISRLGGKTEKRLDVRVIAATNRNLRQEVKKMNFREDLYYRLNVLTFSIPPLHNRKDDIPLLIERFLSDLNTKSRNISGGICPKFIDEDCIACLCSYNWPGNVRELQNTILRAYYCSGNNSLITKEHLPETIVRYIPFQQNLNVQSTSSITFSSEEKEVLIDAIKTCNGNVELAAKNLDISRATFYRKVKRHGIRLKEYRLV